LIVHSRKGTIGQRNILVVARSWGAGRGCPLKAQGNFGGDGNYFVWEWMRNFMPFSKPHRTTHYKEWILLHVRWIDRWIDGRVVEWWVAGW
jgi:hypothetical protein